MRWATPKAAAVASSTPAGIARQRRLGDDDLLGEGADEGCEDAVAEDTPPPAPSSVHAGELAAGDERQRRGHLVLVGDQQHVGEVDRGGCDPDPHLAVDRARATARSSTATTSGGAVRPADRGAHGQP